MTEEFRKFSCYFFLIILVLAACLAAGCNDDETVNKKAEPIQSKPASADTHQKGEQIVAAYLKAIDIPYSKGRIRMTVNTPDEGTKIYEAEVIRRQTSDQTITLTHVVKPENESDLATLAIEKKGQKTENVSYAQSTSKFVEFDSSKQTFGGLTATELLGGELDRYTFNYIGEKNIDGVKSYEVESTLKPGEQSPLARVTTFFREDNSLPIEIHIFNSKGEELRTFHITDYKTIDGHTVTWKTTIENHVNNAKITLEALNLSFPAKMDEALFTRDNLKKLVVKRA
ncbi:MAG TPA: outer membrane lipoprotein-sorting protein [Blastocatellia bacterium]|nr:outer membrane lipoprotein-sorting protein [Blastocatellia bacterium]